MQTIDFVVECDVSSSVRARQAASLFDVPAQEKARQHYRVELPLDEDDWSIGLIVGASGSGKTSVARQAFGQCSLEPLKWNGKSCIDDFDAALPIDAVTAACSAVGFNTVPAWLRPYYVLSNGEKFRVEMARRIAGANKDELVVVDEFTSLVDRHVAKIASYAVQKYVRKAGCRFVAVTCHYDVVDWLQPDWILDMTTRQFSRRLLQRRPSIDVEIKRVGFGAWNSFAPFHYMTQELKQGARNFVLFADGRPAVIAALLWMPVSNGARRGQVIPTLSRIVTFPDYQGLGLAFVLVDEIAARIRTMGKLLRTYPKHYSLVRSFQRSTKWQMIQKPGVKSRLAASSGSSCLGKDVGGSRCAVFEYVGPTAATRTEALSFLGFTP